MGFPPGALDVRVWKHAGWEELVLTLRPDPDLSPEEALLQAVSFLHRQGAELLKALVLCRIPEQPGAIRPPRGMPVTFVEGAPCDEGRVSAVQAWGARGAGVRFVDFPNGAVLSLVEDGSTRWAFLTGLGPSSLWLPPHEQASEVLTTAEECLAVVGMSFRNVYRTWFFLDDILSWYCSFNRARTAFYRDRCVLEGRVPASTGIGARNLCGGALVLDVLALDTGDVLPALQPVRSPLQCSARDYGSSFSRCVEVREQGLRRLLVSGTASIAQDGSSMYPEEVERQTDRTLDVVEAILQSQGQGWRNVDRALVYLRRPDALDVFLKRWAARCGNAVLPAVCLSTVCRDELLFEIELDASEST